ncbi:MAG TPA: hypothetical protein VM008_11670 [Phycisphaerae bacterium]|nr:hypothetical protein [Phycisphaerae bacterium]
MHDTLPTFADLFPHSEPIDRAASTFDTRMTWTDLPAKCALYFLAIDEPAAGNRNMGGGLLATVGNLRAALQRRLTDDPPDTRSKRIQYGRVCTRVHWRLVHSPFAANWWYWNAARTLFPQTYKQMVASRPAWWIALDRDEPYPEFRRTQNLSDSSLSYLGPIRDRTSAGKLIETLEDLFDLCRYHNILLQTPRGKPCAYKEMGKCPAPCDGSVPMDWYYRQLDQALAFLAGPPPESRLAWRAAQQSAMKAAAARLEFEAAAKIKSRLARAELLDAEPYSHLQSLEDFSFVALQPGQGKPYVEPWLIHGGNVECLPQIKKKQIAARAPELFERCRDLAAKPVKPPLDSAAIEQLGIVAHHLFRGPGDAGIYLRLKELTTIEPLLAGIDEIMHHKQTDKPLQEQASDKTPAAAESSTTLEPQIPSPENV